MAQPPDLVRLTTRFDLVNDDTSLAEVAEFSMWGDFVVHPADSAAWDVALLALAQHAVDSWSSVVPSSPFSHGAKLKECLATRADAVGHTVNEQIAVPGTPWQGDATAHSLPWANSLCVSLYTYTPGSFIAHAGRRRGRVYPPPPNVSIISATNQGTVSAADALTYLNHFKSWLAAFSGVVLTPSSAQWTPGVLSRTANAWNVLTDLAIDTKVDTQRRREKSQSATRQSVGISF